MGGGPVGITPDQSEPSKVKVKRRPMRPSAQEVAEHEVHHYPFQPWCRYCVVAAGRRDQRDSVCTAIRDEGIVTISVDYAYLNDEAMDDGAPVVDTHTPILIMKDRESKALFSDVCLEKGAHWHSLNVVVLHILWLGYHRVKLRSDGERPIRSLLDKSAEELKRRGVDVVPDKTPKGDSQSAGHQEAAVNQFKNKVRILWM